MLDKILKRSLCICLAFLFSFMILDTKKVHANLQEDKRNNFEKVTNLLSKFEGEDKYLQGAPIDSSIKYYRYEVTIKKDKKTGKKEINKKMVEITEVQYISEKNNPELFNDTLVETATMSADDDASGDSGTYYNWIRIGYSIVNNSGHIYVNSYADWRK
ncbi:hypothetical protein Q428_12580 [Fervidicella metallireducens AeB]|uniref:Uncharacterized protein n=1 Tax=Fervidicella metallireducens AeB TaxID=1403537 RepID=A0A017RSM4_9CLOT|nr:hypothetical protein [Fervidicella metallireducens]EYE87571.1 hypothetical protein Q428_12580 [Fervidicella metallireducens AeB]